MASPATIRDKVFFAASDQTIYCFKVKDGSKIWDYRTGDKIWSSPSISEYDAVMFFGSLDSHIYGIDINTGRQTWKFPTMNMIDSSAAIASNMMFMGLWFVLCLRFRSHASLYRMTQIIGES